MKQPQTITAHWAHWGVAFKTDVLGGVVVFFFFFNMIKYPI